MEHTRVVVNMAALIGDFGPDLRKSSAWPSHQPTTKEMSTSRQPTTNRRLTANELDPHMTSDANETHKFVCPRWTLQSRPKCSRRRRASSDTAHPVRLKLCGLNANDDSKTPSNRHVSKRGLGKEEESAETDNGDSTADKAAHGEARRCAHPIQNRQRTSAKGGNSTEGRAREIECARTGAPN